MAARTLFPPSLRSSALLRPYGRRTFASSCPRRLVPPLDPQDAHGSIPSSRKLRPRDRLAFDQRELEKGAAAADGSEPAAEAASSPPESIPSTSPAFSSEPLIAAEPSSSSHPPPPSPDSTEVIISPPISDLPPLHSHTLPIPRVPFSTHRFVRRLEDANVPRGMAEELMKATKALLIREEERARGELLSRQDLENEAYLFTAALNELKTGSQVKSRNDSITLKSLTASLQREVDAVEQKMKEDMQRLSSDIQLEANARKEETGLELQGLDKKVMDLNSKFTILLSEVRTEIEATKWISTRRVMTAIVIVVVSVVAYFSSRSAAKKPKKSPSEQQPLSIEELGVQVQPGINDEAEVLPDGTPVSKSGWAFWTGNVAGQGMGVAQGKRVGSEGDEQ
ncbi:hypothetical protein JCM10213_008265 [Rhodosporidiobolus nylandii]